MKLLFENWREFLIERETDQVYSDIIDFVINAYTNPINYEYASKESEQIDKEIMARFIDQLESDPYFMATFQSANTPSTYQELVTHKLTFHEERVDEIYDQLLIKFPKAESLLSYDKFYWTFFALSLKLYYVDADGDPDKETYEEKKGKSLGGYFDTDSEEDGLPQIAVNFGSFLFNPKMSYDEFVSLDNNQIFKLLKGNKGVLRSIIEHEFTHMINSARANTSKKAKGLKRHHRRKKDPRKQKILKYVNSTEEIQARLIPIFSTVKAALNNENLDDSPANQVARVIALQTSPDVWRTKGFIKNIVKLLLRMYDLEHEHYFDLTSQKNKRRIYKRFYEFAQEITSQ